MCNGDESEPFSKTELCFLKYPSFSKTQTNSFLICKVTIPLEWPKDSRPAQVETNPLIKITEYSRISPCFIAHTGSVKETAVRQDMSAFYVADRNMAPSTKSPCRNPVN